MSGKVGDNLFRASGVIAAAEVSGGISWQSVVTASTLTAVAGNGYPIDTTSNACTVTLPASASVGDTIQFTDYARNFATNNLILTLNSLNFQGNAGPPPVYSTDGQSIIITYMNATQGWIPTVDDDVPLLTAPQTQKAIFGYGWDGSTALSMTNLVTSAGVVGSDVTGVGTVRYAPAGAGYGEDKGIFAYGTSTAHGSLGMSNLVTNAGVVGTDVSAVGTARQGVGGNSYGIDKAIFAYGHTSSAQNMSNLVTSAGVVGTDVTGVGTARLGPKASGFGVDKVIFGFGSEAPGYTSITNLVSNVGVVASDVSGVGTARGYIGAGKYGTDKGIFAYGTTGSYVSTSNLVSNVGVVASDVTGVGTARGQIAASTYGADKVIFAYGNTGSYVSMSNLVTNVGVVGSDVTGVGTARNYVACTGYSLTA